MHRLVSVLGLVVYVSARAGTASIADLNECLAASSLDFVKPESGSWDAVRMPFNLRFNIEPAAIVFPESAADVQKAVKCGAENKIPVAARGGGHSYAAFGLGGQGGFLVLDMHKRNKTTWRGNTAIVQTGLRLGNVALDLDAHGRAIPHGVCPQVGVGGHAGCGGYGLTTRQWGLNADALVGAEVVLANGTLVYASDTENSDVFFAIRGAGPSFGVATEYHYKTLEAPPQTAYYRIYFDNNANAEDTANALLAVQDFALTSHFSSSIRLVVASKTYSWVLTGSYPGSKAQLLVGLNPLLNKLPKPSFTNITVLPWKEFLQELSDNEHLGPLDAASVKPQPKDNFYAKSLQIPDFDPVTPESAHRFMEYLYNRDHVPAGVTWFIEADVYGGPGSAVTKVAPDATAYGNRKGLFTFQLYASKGDGTTAEWTDKEFDFVDGMSDALTHGRDPDNTWHFPCYPDPRLPGSEWHKYYGANYPRLVQLKEQLDPNRVFGYAQAVGGPSAVPTDAGGAQQVVLGA